MSIFGNFKNKAMRQVLKSQLKKGGAAGPQQQMILDLIDNNPEVFDKMMTELQAKVKEGKGQNQAMLEVMKKYESELKAAMLGAQNKPK